MADTQAVKFNDEWAVLQQSTPNGNGFSAVLLQRKDAAGNPTAEKVLAIAGTDKSSPADIITDLVNVALYGTVLGMPQYAALESFYAQLVTSGRLGATEQVIVTGHSLGGFLAQAFTARHTSVVSTAYTYNAPGFGAAESLLGFLGVTDATVAAAKITNVHATDGLSMTAGLGVMLGATQPVRIEADANPLNNHSVVTLGDALAIYDTYARLQPSIGMERASALFVASGIGDRRQEDALDALRTVFIGSASNDANRTPTGDRDRFYVNLHALQADSGFKSMSGQVRLIPADTGFASLAQANTNAALAYRYALLELLPFAVVADTEVRNQTLYAAYTQRLSLFDETTSQGELTTQWLTDRAAMLNVLARANTGNERFVYDRNVQQTTIFEDTTSATLLLQLPGPSPAPQRLVSFGGDGIDALRGGGRDDHLYGGVGDDVLNGLGGADYLEGNAGADSLDGGTGADTLLGGAGNDTLTGGSGTPDHDTLIGGQGTDTYTFNAGWGFDTVIDSDGAGLIQATGIGPITGNGAKKLADDTWESADQKTHYKLVTVDGLRNDLFISFSDRSDVIRVQGWSPEKNVGITLAQTIAGTAPPPVDQTVVLADPPGIAGARADLSGSAQSWRVHGTPDADSVYGGFGNDQIIGNGGGDALYGNDGDDLVYANALSDLAAAMVAAQQAHAGAVGNVLDGGRGDDLLIGGDSNWLYGGAGRDTLVGGGGVDLIQGDTFDGGSVQAGVMIAQTFDYDAATHKYTYYVSTTADGVTSYFGRLGLLDDNGADDLIVAGAGDDVADGERGDDDIQLGAGNDIGVGSQGADTISGDAGDDLIFGDFNADTSAQTGNEPERLRLNHAGLDAALHGGDLLAGGDGDDTLYGNGRDDRLYGDAGNDKLNGEDDITPGAYHGTDYLDGGSGNDELAGGGNDDELFGGEGDDRLWGDFGKASDAMLGYQGRDYLDGEAGSDQLVGGGNDDELFGGAGNDAMWGDDTQDYLPVSAHGNDVLDGEDGDDQLTGGGGSDTLFGSAGNDTVHGDDAEANVALSAHGADYLDGGDGDDVLYGDGGADTLVGGAGSDRLDGGPGNDLLIGGAGADELRGGAGDDMYLIAAVDAGDGVFADTITDAQGQNVIELEGVEMGALMVTQANGGTLALSWAPTQGVYIMTGLTSGIGTVIADGEVVSLEELVGSRLTTVVNVASERDGGRVIGGANDDQLTVRNAGTRVSGGQGTDTINLDTGKGGTVAMRVGDGADLVVAARRDAPALPTDPTPQNVLDLGAGFDAAQVRLFKVGARSYIVSLNAQGDGVRFDAATDQSVSIATGAQPFDVVRLSDGSTLSWQQILDRGIAVLPNATEGNDSLALTPIGDVMNGLGGNDYIDGLAGNDVIFGGDGNDTLVGGIGNDVLVANNGFDSLVGGDGNDSLYGGDINSYDVFEGGEGDDQYFFRQGYYSFVDGSATDASLISNDAYHVRDSGQIGGGGYQTWNLTDGGGDSDRLWFDSSLVTPATTTVRSTGTGFTLTAWNLTVNILNAVDLYGNAGAGNVEAVVFANGTTWTTAQVRAMSQQVTPGGDNVYAFAGDDVIDGGAGNDTLNGGGGNDQVLGSAGYDYLNGGAGNDTLDAGADGGLLIGDAGDDSYRVHAGDGDVTIGAGSRAASGDTGRDVLRVAANPSLVTTSYQRGGSSAYDSDSIVVRWNDGSATATFKLFGTQAGASDAVEEIRFADGSSIDVARFVSATLTTPTSGNDSIELTSLDDSIAAGDGDDLVYGKGGNDSIYGGAGGDQLYAGYGDDLVDGGAGDDTLSLGGGNDSVVFGAGSGHDLIATETGLMVAENASVLFGASINPADLRVRWTSATFESTYDDTGVARNWPTAYGNLVASLGSGADSIAVGVSAVSSTDTALQSMRFQDGTTWTLETVIAMANATTAGNDLQVDGYGKGLLQGGDGNDTLYGFNGDNTLEAGSGNDSLIGGDHSDRLVGGAGDDVLRGGAGFNTIVYARGDGDDTSFNSGGGRVAIEFGTGITPSDVALGFESFNLVARVAGGGSITHGLIKDQSELPTEFRFADGTVWSREQILSKVFGGTPGDDTITGFLGSDWISGGPGNDVLTGYTGSDTLDGGSGNDTLNGNGYGSDGAWDQDVLVGGAGDDLLNGGTGYNTYRFDRGFGHDTIVGAYNRNPAGASTVAFGPGISTADLVCGFGSSAGTVLLMPSNGDTVELNLASNDQIQFADGTVWTGADVAARRIYVATQAGDLLYGTAQADVIDALGGNDLEYGGDGNDSLLGGIGDDSLHGDAGDDTLSGGPGNDHLEDRDGNDRYTYQAGDGQDQIQDLAGTNDVLAFGVGMAPSGARVTPDAARAASGTYQITFTGSTDSVTLSGIDSVVFADGTVWASAYIDGLARTINGTSGNDVLNGTSAADRIFGLAGNDQLNGLDGSDWLDGGSGNDTMKGSTGDDTYVVDSVADVVSESSGQGNDRVLSSVTYTLPSNVERMDLTGNAATNGTGNSLLNVINGNAGINRIDGGAGADTLAAGAGNDTYVVDNAGDTLIELVGCGTDVVESSLTWTLGAELETLTLTGGNAINGTGNAAANTINGNSGANRLDGAGGADTLVGGAGIDTLIGGAGDDLYGIDVSTDVVTELAAEGIDLVQSAATFALSANVENLTLTGSLAINGTGNALDNTLAGNSANNTLTGGAGNDWIDGGAGNDTMIGGAGNDTFVANVATDVITENANEGIDTVQSAVTWTLAANLENLTLIGAAAINGTGNANANIIIGNAAANTLTGAEGNDTYDGGAGNDVYVDASLSSNDTYRWGLGMGTDTLNDKGGALDHIDLLAGVTRAQLKFVKYVNNLELSVIGQTDKLVIGNWYASVANQVEEFRLSDGSKVLASEVQGLLSAMALFNAPAGLATTGLMTAQPVRRHQELAAALV